MESITRVVNGDGGARLFAREDGLIYQVVIFGEVPFAIAQVRYELAPSNQALFILLALLIIVVLVVLRKAPEGMGPSKPLGLFFRPHYGSGWMETETRSHNSYPSSEYL